MSYGDACEGAKSNALMRLCKGLGISLELWKPSFVQSWKKKHAETYYDKQKGKTLWRKKALNGRKDVAGDDTSGNEAERTPLSDANSQGHAKPLKSREFVAMLKAVKNLDELKGLWTKHHDDFVTYSDNVKKQIISAKDTIKSRLKQDMAGVVNYKDIIAFQPELGSRRFIKIIQPYQPVCDLDNGRMVELKGKLSNALDEMNNEPVKA